VLKGKGMYVQKLIHSLLISSLLISLPILAQTENEPRPGEYKEAGIFAQDNELASSELNGSYIFLIYVSKGATGLIYDVEFPKVDVNKADQAPEENMVSHRSLLARLNKKGYDKVTGAGEFKIFNGTVTEINNRAGTFRHTNMKANETVLASFGLKVSEQTKLINYDLIFETDTYKRALALYRTLLKKFPSFSDPELVDYSRLVDAAKVLDSSDGDELIKYVMRVETSGTSRTLTLPTYSDTSMLDKILNDMEKVINVDMEQQLRSYIKNVYLDGAVKSDDMDVLSDAVIKKVCARTQIEREDIELFVTEKEFFKYLLSRARDTQDSKLKHRRLYQIVMIKAFFMSSMVSIKDPDRTILFVGVQNLMNELEPKIQKLNYNVGNLEYGKIDKIQDVRVRVIK
jgi:hypothetical protein